MGFIFMFKFKHSLFTLHFAICNYQFAICLCLLLAIASSARAEPPLVVPVEGKPFRAALTAISAEGNLSFLADGKTKQLPLAELVLWGTPLESRRGPLIVLADGGLLSADVLSADKDRLDVDSDLFGRLKLPLEKLSGVIFRLPGSVRERDRLLKRISSAAGDSDRLLLDNGDELTGTLEAIGEKQVNLQTDAGPANVELSRVDAILFNPQLKGKPEEKSQQTWLGFNDGSRLSAKSISSFPTNLRSSPGEGQGGKADQALQFSLS